MTRDPWPESPDLDALSFEELAAHLERTFEQPRLSPETEERRRRCKDALRRAEEHLRRNPIGRGEWDRQPEPDRTLLRICLTITYRGRRAARDAPAS